MTLAITVWHISTLLGKEAQHRKQAAQHSLLRTVSENFPIFHESSSCSPCGKLLSIQSHMKELPGNISTVQREGCVVICSVNGSCTTAFKQFLDPLGGHGRKWLQFSLYDDSSLPPGSTWRFCHQGLVLVGRETTVVNDVVGLPWLTGQWWCIGIRNPDMEFSLGSQVF